MKESTYSDFAYGSIWPFRQKCSKEEFKGLSTEVARFCNSNKDLPVSEQKRLFDEKYGYIVNYNSISSIKSEVRSINSKLSFFLILTVITLIVAVIGAMFGSL